MLQQFKLVIGVGSISRHLQHLSCGASQDGLLADFAGRIGLSLNQVGLPSLSYGLTAPGRRR
ncbi:hypothetical protein KR100_10540 [Synechococcus sp. KORDI-100]|nr:hypothetical protein KR100_10540 [Synechococcus sp. KORDI-100]